MTNDPHIQNNKKWLAGLLAIPALALVLIAIICVAEFFRPKYPAVFTGKLLSVRDDAIEVEGYGLVPLSPECGYFLTFDGSDELPLSSMMSGSTNLEFVTENDGITHIREIEEQGVLPIRVLLMSQDFDGCFHESISVISDGAISVSQNGKEYEIPAGEEVTFNSGDDDLSSARIILTPDAGNETEVRSFSRAEGYPSYPGRLEILDTEEGLVLINELDMETYLTRVVPSEMEGYFEPEALKAQAVCARTYACTQQRENRYLQFGAQLDDSTNYQVYNNVKEDANATKAVRDTAGEMILYDGSPIAAFYFSTSCGNTTDSSVWGMDPEDTPYLKSVALQPERRTLDWSDETEFDSFIKRQDVTAYDSDSVYFRWRADITSDLLSRTFSDIGTVTEAKITKRGGGGVALEMTVTGTEGEAVAEGQYAIRQALCDTQLAITRNDGSEADGFSALPSAFLCVESVGTDEDGVTYFVIYGGGYGHGAGMSQNGAQGMAKAGMDYTEILRFFYDGVTIEKTYR